VREADGLAMSSRNSYLSADERERGLNISRALFLGLRMLDAGERDGVAIVKAVKAAMRDLDIDYVELVDTRELKPVARVDGPVMLAVAAFVGKTRLIDNVRFDGAKQEATEETESGHGVEVEVNAL
jgi:pantoate--beta-alanine ligase